MGLLQDLAAVAIRTQVIAALRADCPAALKDDLEQLLGDNAAIAAIQKIVMAAVAAKRALTPDAFAALSLKPALADYLCATANAKMPR